MSTVRRPLLLLFLDRQAHLGLRDADRRGLVFWLPRKMSDHRSLAGGGSRGKRAMVYFEKLSMGWNFGPWKLGEKMYGGGGVVLLSCVRRRRNERLGWF